MSTKQNPPGWREVDGVKLPPIDWAERADTLSDENYDLVCSVFGETARRANPDGCICQEQHRRGYCTEPGCRWVARVSPSQNYERALRECLLDSKAIIEGYRDGKRFDHMGSFDGQVKALLRDIRNILNREDCPNYNFRKDKPNG